MKNYPAYNESGVGWIGEIPSHWQIDRGKFLYRHKKEVNSEFQCNNRLSLTLNGVLKKGKSSAEGLSPDDYRTYQVFYPDNLVFKLIDLENIQTSRVGIVPEKGIMSPVYIRLEGNSDICARFGFYQFYDLYKQHVLNVLGKGVRSSLSASDLLEIPLAFPALSEQRAIAAFLDRKTAQIDELIRGKERRIALLREKRTALINRAVTKGLDPNVEMKPSGVEWIGEIPRHWRVKRLKHASKIVASYVDKHVNPDEIQVDLCNYINVYYSEKIASSINFMKGSCNQDEYERSLLNKGDVVITKDSESPDDIGVPAFVQEELTNVVCGYHLSIIRPENEVDGEFLFRFIQSKQACRYFGANSTGITRFSLGKSAIENLPILLPPLPEQTQIADFLDGKTAQIDELMSAEERKIELLKEYRQSLISDVVTGKIDVRNEV